jgi:class 3 adenylate cyclase
MESRWSRGLDGGLHGTGRVGQLRPSVCTVEAAEPTPEELAAAGIYDPDDDLASERLELIRFLLGLGATVDDLVAARPNLAVVASSLALRGPGRRVTAAEAARRAGVDVDLALRIWHVGGFPDPGPDAPAYTDEDIDALRTFQAGAEFLGDDVMLQVVRVMGSSLARIADAVVGAFVVNVAAPSLQNDESGLGLARANWEAVALLREAARAMDVMFRRHVERLQRPLTDGDQSTQVCAVGFADLVGSTALAQQLSFADLAAALTEFDELASDVVVDGGARVVKLIGDSVMFVTGDPDAACEIALALSERLADHPRLPSARVALAYGEVLTRDGDYYGPVVNLAARAEKLATPGTVLVTGALRDAADGFSFTRFGECELKGFDEPVELFEVRRP